jgi:hypothetical protein
MLAARSERDAVSGTLLFNIMHYAVRPWPWIITALASTLVYPQLTDIANAFPYVDPALIGHDVAYPAMMRFLPVGFLGLVVAGTLASYRSTISTGAFSARAATSATTFSSDASPPPGSWCSPG